MTPREQAVAIVQTYKSYAANGALTEDVIIADFEQVIIQTIEQCAQIAEEIEKDAYEQAQKASGTSGYESGREVAAGAIVNKIRALLK